MPIKFATEVPTVLHHVIMPDDLLAELVSRQDEVLDLREAAAFLKIPEQAVLQMVREQGLPARQVGEDWRLTLTPVGGTEA